MGARSRIYGARTYELGHLRQQSRVARGIAAALTRSVVLKENLCAYAARCKGG
jgi:hypothetical protein